MTKQTRASKPKVKTGCITCKIRHVKCDEEKPECHQCKKTGRKCDGYDAKPPKHHHSKPKPARLASGVPAISSDHCIVLRPGTREERQYVELFCNQTSRAISGFFGSDFWNYLLPQLSYSQPAIRHAIAAVGAIHERFLHAPSLPAPSAGSQNEPFALQQYNKAIKHLMDSFPSSEQSLDLTLITCCLFVCLEMLRGNNEQALNHLEAGLRILCRRQKKRLEWSHYHNRLAEGFGAVFEQELSYLFARFNIQLSLFGRPLAPFEPSSGDSNASDTSHRDVTFSTILEARHSLDRLMNKALRFIRSAADKTNPTPYSMLLQEQFDISRELNDWSNAFEDLTKRLKRRTRKELDPRGPLLLRIHHLTSKIWLETGLTAEVTTWDTKDVMAWDRHYADFETIVSNAALVLNNKSSEESGRDHEVDNVDRPTDNFCLDMGIILPLYRVATKCRHPIIRRKAIDLLSTHPRQEGLWNSRCCAKLGELVMAVEEAQVIRAAQTSFATSDIFDANSTSFALEIFSPSDPNPLFHYYYTAPPIANSTSGVKTVDENTVFRIGSVSKLWTVYLFLIETGDARFDDPVAKYVPELRSAAAELSKNTTERGDVIDFVQWEEVTIRELASHLSGIARDYFFKGLLKSHPVVPTSSTPIYSNAAFQVLAYALEGITNQTYRSLLSKTIIEPLNLSRSSYSKPPDEYGIIPGDATTSWWNVSFGDETPAGGLYSSAKDTSTLGRAILNSTLLSPKVTRRLMKPVTHTSSLSLSVGAPWEIFSFEEAEIGRVVDLYTKQGDVESYSSVIALSPDHNVGFTILGAGGTVTALSDVVAAAIIPSLNQAGKEQADKTFSGTYSLTSSSSSSGGHINSSITITTDDGPGLKVDRWISNSTDMFTPMSLALGSQVLDSTDVSIRLYPLPG
ncbi:hypothetical protein VTN00DRAFT_4950 [Thermoascus crustaceus]|uniref:uncharacterized protein n=1 Tax=Thermoascus crustaceus TaxID=5088 RepID=UPI0037447AFE